MAKKQFLKLRRLAEDQDITTDELAAKAGIVPRTLRKRFAAPESCGTWNWEEITAICRELHIPQEQIGEYFWTSTFCLRSPHGSKTLIQTERFSAHFPKIFVHRTMDLTGAIA